jgi:hypothetical protein
MAESMATCGFDNPRRAHGLRHHALQHGTNTVNQLERIWFGVFMSSSLKVCLPVIL